MVADERKPVGSAGAMGGFYMIINPRRCVHSDRIGVVGIWLRFAKCRDGTGCIRTRRIALKRGADFEIDSFFSVIASPGSSESGGVSWSGGSIDVVARGSDQSVWRCMFLKCVIGGSWRQRRSCAFCGGWGLELIREPGEGRSSRCRFQVAAGCGARVSM